MIEIFQTLAEISIGILGFTAIVIMFRPHHSKWNNNMYQGMIGHSMQALYYPLSLRLIIASLITFGPLGQLYWDLQHLDKV